MNDFYLKLLIGVALILVAIFVLYFVGDLAYKNRLTKNNDCLIQKAINFCEENNYSYNDVYFFRDKNLKPVYSFNCKKDERKDNLISFRFLKSELKECQIK